MEHLSAFPIKNFHSEHTKLFLTHLPSPCQPGKGIFKCLSICFMTSKCSGNSLSTGKTLPPAAIEHLKGGKPSPDHFCLFTSKPLHEHAAIWKKGFFSRGKRSQILVPSAVCPVTQCAVRDCGHSSSPALREVPVPSGKSHPLWDAVSGAASHGCWSINELIFVKYCEGLGDQESRSSSPRLQTHGEETRRHEFGFHATVML